MVLTKWEGTECFNYSPFIYAYQCTNVAVTGKGTIDGNGSVTFNGWHAIQGPAVDRLRQMGIDSVPVYQRVFGEGHYLRPCMIQFYGCKNVLVEDLKIYDSPFWIIHPVFCDNVTVRNVYIDSNNYNNDGCDPGILHQCTDRRYGFSTLVTTASLSNQGATRTAGASVRLRKMLSSATVISHVGPSLSEAKCRAECGISILRTAR